MGSARKGFTYEITPQSRRASSLKLRLSLINVRDAPLFPSLVPVSSLCQRRLAYISYESWLLGVFRIIYTNLKLNLGHRKFADLTSIPGPYIRGIHRVP